MPFIGKLVTACSLLCLLPAAGFAQWPAANPAYQTGFPVLFDNSGNHVRSSSVVLADIDNDDLPEIIVGTSDGRVQAYDGDGSKLWQYPPVGGGTMAMEGKAAVADIDGDGFQEIVIGAGSTFTPAGTGQLYVLSHTGALQCSFTPRDTSSNGHPDGVFSSPALADLDENDGGKLEIVFGGWDIYVYVLNDDCSLFWEKDMRDSVWSSPAIVDLDRDGHLEIVIGVDSHIGPFTEDGGVLHVFRRDGSAELPGFPFQLDEVIYSSPAIGDITGDGQPEIIVGTGRCWDNPDCAPGGRVHPDVGEYINAWDTNGDYLPGWPVTVPGEYAFASPALADVDEDGVLEVVINTIDKNTLEGKVYVLNGDGSAVAGWPQQPSTPAGCFNLAHSGTGASTVVADVDGDSHLEIILASTWELVVWDYDGRQLTRDSACPSPPQDLLLITNFTLNSAAAVGDLDGDNDLEIVVGGGASGTTGAIYAWDFSGPATEEATPWPQFRRTANNHSNVDTGSIFTDGFESGDRTLWSFSTPP